MRQRSARSPPPATARTKGAWTPPPTIQTRSLTNRRATLSLISRAGRIPALSPEITRHGGHGLVSERTREPREPSTSLSVLGQVIDVVGEDDASKWGVAA